MPRFRLPQELVRPAIIAGALVLLGLGAAITDQLWCLRRLDADSFILQAG